MSDKAMLRREVSETLAALLTDAGFRKRSGRDGGIFLLDLAPNVSGWLSVALRTVRLDPRVAMWSCVGVRFHEVERIVAECSGHEVDPVSPPTVSQQIGYWIPDPDHREWTFDSRNLSRMAADYLKAVTKHAIPHMRSLANLDAVGGAVARGLEESRAYRGPVIAALAGDRALASRLLDEALAERSARSDGAADNFRSFARVFMAQHLARSM